MPLVFFRPPVTRGALPGRRKPQARVVRPAFRPDGLPTLTSPPLRRAASLPRLTRPELVQRHVAALAAVPPSFASPAPPSDWDGPNPYAGFRCTFTDEGGIKLTFMAKNERAWPRWVQVGVWLLAMAGTVWIATKVSPVPLVPRGCALFSPCPVSLPPLQQAIDAVLLTAMGLLYAWLLFGDEERLASIEIRRDCMILDDAEVFWLRHMELGWPKLEWDHDCDAKVLRGVYGTRRIRYVTLPAADDDDDWSIQVLGAHLQFAMQQLWDQPEG